MAKFKTILKKPNIIIKSKQIKLNKDTFLTYSTFKKGKEQSATILLESKQNPQFSKDYTGQKYETFLQLHD